VAVLERLHLEGLDPQSPHGAVGDPNSFLDRPDVVLFIPARRKERQVGDRKLMSHHVHMELKIPLKYAPPQVVRDSHEKGTIRFARVYSHP